MPFDDDPDDERPGPDRLLPPEDRLWRHPSEVGAGLGPLPLALPDHPDPSERSDRRAPARTALAGACLAGAMVALGAMWIARPTRVVEEGAPSRSARTPVTTQTAAFNGSLPTRQLVDRLGNTVAHLRIERDGRWTSGSALWIDERGTLATATPLVAGATQILVIGADRRQRTALLVGSDPATGVSALVVDQTSGTPVAVAEAPPRTGDAAAVVGANGADAGGDNGDPTMAVVVIRSVSLRATVGDVVVHDAIQLDRAIPTDAHGGGLVDAHGALLGMVMGNSAERNLGAVVPARLVVASSTDLRDHGKVRRAWLGVRAVDLDPSQAAVLRVDGGAQLTEITAQSPAAAAGFKVGDVIMAIDEQPIDDASDLVNDLVAHEPGDQVVVRIRRDAADHTFTVDLGG